MATEMVANTQLSEALERAITRNDFSQVSIEDRMRYLSTVCQSLSLNPLTMPLAYLTDRSGKVTLYMRKEGTEQLRKIHNVTLEVVSQGLQDDCYVVHVRATAPSGKGRRSDEDIGAVAVAGLKGEARANAMMKALTKAKRRATLSLCGLGMPDESEVEDTRDLRPAQDAPTIKIHTPPALPAPTLAIAPPEPVQNEEPPGKPVVATQEQLTELRRLKDLHRIDAPNWLKILNKRGVNTATNLTHAQAAELIHAMQARAVAQQLEADAAEVVDNGREKKESSAAGAPRRGGAF